MVKYIRSDLEFILAQIKIAEAHAAGATLYGTDDALIPAYNIAWGLRTVDGSYNHLLPGQEQWGASDTPFNELVNPTYRTVMVDPDGAGPSGPIAIPYTPGVDIDGPTMTLPDGTVIGNRAGPGDVIDPSLRTISNLIVDQTLANPIAIMVGLQRAGVVADEEVLDAAIAINTAFKSIAPLFAAVNTAQVNQANAEAAFNANPSPENEAALNDANAALADAQTTLDGANGALNTLIAAGGLEMDDANVLITNAAPDEGLSAPFNSWFTLFGQFFDHGLDLVNKGGSGTVMVPLMPDDPLYVPGSPTNFMVLTRATTTAGPDGVFNTADDVRPINTTTAYVDQNQTYTSHPSHQVFLRQYVMTADGPVATGKLIEGANGGMANWGEVKAQARDLLGITLTDLDVGMVPLLRTDAYGNFIPGPGGYPQIVVGVGADGVPNTADDLVVSGSASDPVSLTGAIRTNMAFLADIAHFAVPDGLADGDIEVGGNIPEDGFYDNELLDAHFIAGDGRANENIGLTAVHHVFHSEHNRLVQHTKDTVLESGDLAFVNEWLATDIAVLPATPAEVEALVWDGERLFQAAKFGTEMQYQHLVFEEFARKIQPNINVFLVPDGFDTMMDPTIFAEFAHVVYRFGHSMLNESIDQFDPQFNADNISLIQGFLNPAAFDGPNGESDHDLAAGAIIRGMTRQVGNEIDEFVTSALRNNLLGLPLDLATINLARGRDTGVPSLNEARRSFFEMTNQDALLTPYGSWVDFAGNLKHEASIINFVAAYGTHSLITGEATIEGKRDAAMTLIFGEGIGKFAVEGFVMPTDAQDFLNGTGAYAVDLGGLEKVDLWIGGLAEKIMPFGGMLGSTFNFVFEAQMELLQSGDRFYYLQRLDGLHLFGEMENNSFAAMMMRNTDATHLPSDVFSTPGLILEIDRTRQYNPGLGEEAGADGILEDDPGTLLNESADNLGLDPVGGGILTPLVIRNNPATPGADTNYLRYTGGDHVVLGGTNSADILVAGIGDDTLYGDDGNDVLEGGFGNDIINAGDGDDIIKDMGGDDNIKAGAGNDVVHAGPGLDLVMGNDGQDFIFLGTDMGSEVFAGQGDDFIYGNRNAERILGNEGNDWIETGTFDGAPGDNFDEVFAHDGIDGHDVFLGDGGFDEFIGEGGDDIMVGSTGRGKMAGMSGFDWATYKDSTFGINADLSRPIVFDEAPTLPINAALDEYASMEGLSGSRFNDILGGSNALAEERLPAAEGGSEGHRGSRLTKEGVQLISGLADVLGLTTAQVNAMAAGQVVFSAGDILLGGDGSDIIQGNGGDDIIDGDKWLDVQIAVYATTDRTGEPIAVHNSMTTLAASMFNGSINPGQLGIIRTIKIDTTAGDVDIARFQGARNEYAFSATADGQVIVKHAIENQIDGTDQLRNIERVEFSDGNPLNIIVGTSANDTLNGTPQDDLMLGLAGADTLNGGAGNDILVGGPGGVSVNISDNFSNGYTGGTGFAGNWTEANDTGGSATGDIRVTGGRLAFVEGTDGGETITRSVNLAGLGSVTLSFNYEDDSLDGGENVVVEAWTGSSWQALGTFGGNTDSGSDTFSVSLSGNLVSANSQIRFRTEGTFEGGENFYIDNIVISSSGNDTLNGGLGDDTYSFALGDGNDVINEAVNATSGGAADRISILAPITGTDPLTDLPIMALTGLNASDSNTGTQAGDLVITYGLSAGAPQTVTVAGHFAGTNAATGVERINFNGATYAGYLLGAEDYLISRLDPANRDSGGVNLSASLVNSLVVGEDGVSDVITGGQANDLIFGGSGNNNLVGGDGDDLLVGGAGNDSLDARDTGDPDNLDLVGALGADTMIGGAGNDTYGVDDLLDVVVEAVNEGTDTVETFMAALSLEAMANVENLSYEGGDGDQFVGTGNALNNEISGGDLADTLRGLAGNDELNGGLGADTLDGGDGNDALNGGDDNDILVGGAGNDQLDGGAGADNMTGGDGDDIYVVDDAGDVIVEAAGATSGVDRVDASFSYTLGANFENLNLGGGAVVGTGNAANNVINGNGGANQLFGAAGNDTINGNDGNDLIDGGEGNDIINGGDDNDTVIGGAGDDTINVGSGNDLIRYTATGFGADVITGFDATGGSIANQDIIDLSALGVTTANFATRVFESTVGGNTLITVREGGAASAILGTIQLNGVANAAVDASDFLLAAAAPPPFGAATNGANTITGNAAANTIDGLGGNDTLNGAGGNDVLIGSEGADFLNGGDGNDTLTGGRGSDVGTYLDNFSNGYAGNSGNLAFSGSWTEGGGETTSATGGDIQITGGRLAFLAGTDGGETIQRSINLAGATSASLTFNWEADDLDAGENVLVEAFNGSAWQLLGTLGGDTTGTFTGSLTAAHTAIRFRAVGNFETGGGGTSENFYIDNVTISVTQPGLNAGVDALNGDAGDDTAIWNANTTGTTDGRDIVNGGAEGAAGDTFVINGNASAEQYRIYTRAAWLAVPGNTTASLAAATEIVITRNGVDAASVIAELNEIEEIRINGVDPTSAGGTASGDTFEVIGDFSQTSLRPNTITIVGSSADDVLDITGLASAHRVVFDTNGGTDTVTGEKREQDVINVTGGGTVNDNRVVAGGQDDDEEDHDDNGHDDDHDEEESEDEDVVMAGGSGDDKLTGGSSDDVISGGSGDDTLKGRSGEDTLNGGSGDDILAGGSGNDALNGGSGDDELEGGSGDDVLDGGSGDDVLTGGSGADVFRFGASDSITDFETGDRIDLSSEGVSAANFASTVSLSQSGDDTWLKVGSSKMLISGVDAGDLDIADFILSEATAQQNSATAGSHVMPGSVAEVLQTLQGLSADGSLDQVVAQLTEQFRKMSDLHPDLLQRGFDC